MKTKDWLKENLGTSDMADMISRLDDEVRAEQDGRHRGSMGDALFDQCVSIICDFLPDEIPDA